MRQSCPGSSCVLSNQCDHIAHRLVHAHKYGPGDDVVADAVFYDLRVQPDGEESLRLESMSRSDAHGASNRILGCLRQTL